MRMNIENEMNIEIENKQETKRQKRRERVVNETHDIESELTSTPES